jgi:hypothetical protein
MTELVTRALAQLSAPLGLPGSGRLRYASAMTLYQHGRLSADALEVYRICSPRDGEDPVKLLKMRGLGREILTPVPASAETAIRTFVEEADRYLSALPGPGIAEVRAGISAVRDVPVVERPSMQNAVQTSLMPVALGVLGETHPALANAIAAVVPHLEWITYDSYPVDLIGRDFPKSHAFASVIGVDAPIFVPDFDFGLFLISPHVLYRDHKHKAPELYAPLTGPHGWRFGPDLPLVIKPAHEPVWNDPFVPHMTKVGPVPFLSLFCWTRDASEIADVVPASDWAALEVMRLDA